MERGKIYIYIYISPKTGDKCFGLIFYFFFILYMCVCVLLMCKDVVHHSIDDVERQIILLDGRDGDPVLSPLHVKLWYTSSHSSHNFVW